MTAEVLMLEDRYDGSELHLQGARAHITPELAMIWLSLGVATSVPADEVIEANEAAIALAGETAPEAGGVFSIPQADVQMELQDARTFDASEFASAATVTDADSGAALEILGADSVEGDPGKMIPTVLEDAPDAPVGKAKR